jgi:hypothetical protein
MHIFFSSLRIILLTELSYGTLSVVALGDYLDMLRQRHLLNWREDAKNLALAVGTEAFFLFRVIWVNDMLYPCTSVLIILINYP